MARDQERGDAARTGPVLGAVCGFGLATRAAFGGGRALCGGVTQKAVCGGHFDRVLL